MPTRVLVQFQRSMLDHFIGEFPRVQFVEIPGSGPPPEIEGEGLVGPVDRERGS